MGASIIVCTNNPAVVEAVFPLESPGTRRGGMPKEDPE